MHLKQINLPLALRIIATTLLLLTFGLIMIYSASVSEALRDFGTKWYFVNLQLKWSLVGLAGMLIASRIPIKFIEKLAPLALFVGLALLVAVLIPGLGTKVYGARRWIATPIFNIQPSELIKLIEIIYLSSWLSKKKVTLPQFLGFIGVFSGLIMLQPDMGTTIVVTLIACAMYFLAGYPIKHLLLLGGIGIGLAVVLIAIEPYRLARVTTLFNPESDPQGSSYHIRQVLLALGSGGATGVGIGRSRQKYEYLPESTTDSIFAVVGEELGFIGAIALIISFCYFIYQFFKIGRESRSHYGSLLATGIGCWIGLQVLLNLSAMVALAPLTGIPLPLVSYGGSSLVTMLLGIGLAISVAREERL
ncbi:MAG: putative lipid II flippase FtsW [bacterium]